MFKRLLLITVMIILFLIIFLYQGDENSERGVAYAIYSILALNLLACLIGALFNPYFTYKNNKLKMLLFFLFIFFLANFAFYLAFISSSSLSDLLSVSYPFNIIILSFLLSFIFFQKPKSNI